MMARQKVLYAVSFLLSCMAAVFDVRVLDHPIGYMCCFFSGYLLAFARKPKGAEVTE